MKLIVEKQENKWIIMLYDMLGRRRYNNIDFNSKNEAIDFLHKEFKDDNDILKNIE